MFICRFSVQFRENFLELLFKTVIPPQEVPEKNAMMSSVGKVLCLDRLLAKVLPIIDDDNEMLRNRDG